MPNEQTSVPLYAASEILTAANMNISAGTGVPVFATTVTRDAAFGGANEKVLAEGQLCYLSASNIVQYYDGAAWATVGPAAASGLTLITTQVIGTTVASVTISSCFSSTYDNYKITINGGVGTGTINLRMVLGATTTGYYFVDMYRTYANTDYSTGYANQALFTNVGGGSVNALAMNVEIGSPNLAKRTTISSPTNVPATDAGAGIFAGYLDNNTQYTAFTLSPSSGTLTGGTIRVYGYQNS